MNNSAIARSSEGQGSADASWATAGESWERSGGGGGAGGGVEAKQYQWDWENAMLLSHNASSSSSSSSSEDEQQERDRKVQIMASIMPTTSFAPHPIAMLRPQGMPSTSGGSFHGLMSSFQSSPSPASLVDQRRHLLAMASMQGQGPMAMRGSEASCGGDGAGRIGLNLGVRTYFATTEERMVKRSRVHPSTGAQAQAPLCQADGCRADLSDAKHYHRRHKVCELHSKAATVVAHGQTQRFCQQCSRFHVLSEFDDGKRSCRKRLADHNRRRRKPQAGSITVGAAANDSLMLVKKEDVDQSANNQPAGRLATAISMPNAQSLLSAISLSPSVALMNPNRQLPALAAGRTTDAVYQYLQGIRQTGTHLSLSPSGAGRNQLAQQQNAGQQHYGGVDVSVPWLSPAASSRSDTNDSGAPSLNLQHLIPSNKNDRMSSQASSEYAGSMGNASEMTTSMGNARPRQEQGSREAVARTEWLGGGEDGMQFGQEALSLLDGGEAQEGGGRHSQKEMKLGERQVLRPFRTTTMYSSSNGSLL